MSNPPEISPEKKKVPRRVVEDVGRIRGALSGKYRPSSSRFDASRSLSELILTVLLLLRLLVSDTTHLLKSFKDSLGDIVVANKAASASIEELVGVCKEERREIKVAMEKIGELESRCFLPSSILRTQIR